MAANKGRKRKTGKGAPGRKSRLWLRDLLNLLGGLLVGALGLWIVQEFLEGRAAGEASGRYRGAIEQDMPKLKLASQRYEALSEQSEAFPQSLEGLEAAGALYRIDAYEAIERDVQYLKAEVRPLLLGFSHRLREAELLRKLIIDQREHPEQMPQILAREFLKALDEGARLAPRLLQSLGPDGRG
jgi:hypothetical protein